MTLIMPVNTISMILNTVLSGIYIHTQYLKTYYLENIVFNLRIKRFFYSTISDLITMIEYLVFPGFPHSV